MPNYLSLRLRVRFRCERCRRDGRTDQEIWVPARRPPFGRWEIHFGLVIPGCPKCFNKDETVIVGFECLDWHVLEELSARLVHKLSLDGCGPRSPAEWR